MNFVHTLFPDDTEEEKEGDVSEDALSELDDEFDEDDKLEDDAEEVDFDLHDDVDEF